MGLIASENVKEIGSDAAKEQSKDGQKDCSSDGGETGFLEPFQDFTKPQIELLNDDPYQTSWHPSRAPGNIFSF
jgi:hypothetical protein